MKKLNRNVWSNTLSCLTLILISIIDIFLPPEVSIGVLYILCFMFLRGANHIFIFTLALIVLAFSIIKLYLNEDFKDSPIIILNTLLNISAVVFSAQWAAKDKILIDLNEHVAKAFKLEIKDKKTQLALQNNYFYHLMDNMLEGVQLISHDLKYLYVNNACEIQSGYKKEELLGYSMSYRYPGIENTPLMQSITRCLKEETHITFINEFEFPDGKIGYYELFLHPVAEGLYILSIDVTERIYNENQRKSYTEELEKKLNSK